MSNWTLKHKIARFVATGGYSGLSPIMPGTVGSIAAFLISVVVFKSFALQSHITVCLTLVAICTVAGLCCCRCLLRSDHYDAKNHDPQEFVIDEFAGYFVTVVGLTEHTGQLLLGLLCFRVFDILKPPPVNTVEQLPGAWGIMLDDIVAGIYAAMLCRAVLSFW